LFASAFDAWGNKYLGGVGKLNIIDSWEKSGRVGVHEDRDEKKGEDNSCCVLLVPRPDMMLWSRIHTWVPMLHHPIHPPHGVQNVTSLTKEYFRILVLGSETSQRQWEST
jgi:hypothetical protein